MTPVLRYYNDPILRRKAAQVGQVDDEIRTLVLAMFEIMRTARGVGLAANQVGVPLQVLTLDLSIGGKPRGEMFAIINPKVVRKSGSITDEEGCLSFPGLRLMIRRPMEVRVEGLDLNGNPVALEAGGILARAVMHETDHLNGIQFFRRLPFLKLLAFLPTLPKLRRQYRNLKGTTPAREE
jgi:peptide deformylase